MWLFKGKKGLEEMKFSFLEKCVDKKLSTLLQICCGTTLELFKFTDVFGNYS